jgi:murein DD-endopeptidase MepM/ murein hydrolase activator NlpD
VTADVSSIVERARLAAGTPSAATAGGSERVRLERVAQEFEAMLLVQVLRGMRTSGSWDNEEGDSLGAESMYETMDVELASHLARVQGLGLSKQLLAAFDRMNAGKPAAPGAAPLQLPTASSGVSGIGPAAAAAPAKPAAELMPRVGTVHAPVQPVAAAVVPDADLDAHEAAETVEAAAVVEGAVLSPVAGKVTSDFGWRRDPFTGRAKFHRGIDLRAAYGEDVQAAGEGRVVFSGQQGGYGTTVMIEHADGTRTRYAHLSVALVEAGEKVDSGQPVGRAGRSGRATGTHVHFELIGSDGRHLDPGHLTERRGQL